jgi:cytochrome c
MSRRMRALACAAALACLPVALLAAPAGAPETQERASDPDADPSRAQALLARAVARLKEKGDKALADFSLVDEFVDHDLYVYILSPEGVMLASGGSSSNYVGRSIVEYRDTDGRHPFQEMIDLARTRGEGRIEYRWLNLRDGRVERKIALFQAVDGRIAAVGYYLPRATPEQARSVLWRAVDEINRLGPEAFARFNDINGSFVQDDTYVFVVGLKDRRMYAHGAMPRLVGRNVADLTDAKGVPIMQKMIDIANHNGAEPFEYMWRNPVTGNIEHKHTFVHKVGEYMVGVGYYEP